MKKFSEGFASQTSGGRSGSRANSRPWHVSHALRHFRRVPTRLLSRMRAGCVSRDAQRLSMPVNGRDSRVSGGAWDTGDLRKFFRCDIGIFFLTPEWKLWILFIRGISMRGIYRSAEIFSSKRKLNLFLNFDSFINKSCIVSFSMKIFWNLRKVFIEKLVEFSSVLIKFVIN